MAWSFDPRTAILIGALVTWLTAGMLLLNWKSLPDNVRPSLRWWLAGIALHPIGFTLIALRDQVPIWAVIALGATSLAASFSCMAIALRSFYGLPERRLPLCVITLMVGAAAVWFTFFAPHLQARIIIVHVLLAMLIGSGARAWKPCGRLRLINCCTPRRSTSPASAACCCCRCWPRWASC